jgi:hypothetical protein
MGYRTKKRHRKEKEMILTPTEVTILSSITASVATIVGLTYIEEVQETVCLITNNYFTIDLDIQDTATFDLSSRSIILSSGIWIEKGFSINDDVLIYHSYKNDKLITIESISNHTCIITSSNTVIDELSGRSIIFTVVKWPITVKRIAAQMIAFDYDVRPKKSLGVKNFSLGPFSETYTIGDEDDYGYPKALTDRLIPYRRARLM